MYNSWKRFRNSASLLRWPITQYRHKFFISLMHDRGFGLIGPRQVHAVYTMHTCRAIYTGTTWHVTSSVPMLYRRYMYAMCSSVARLVMVGSDSFPQSAILHQGCFTSSEEFLFLKTIIPCFNFSFVSHGRSWPTNSVSDSQIYSVLVARWCWPDGAGLHFIVSKFDCVYCRVLCKGKGKVADIMQVIWCL